MCNTRHFPARPQATCWHRPRPPGDPTLHSCFSLRPATLAHAQPPRPPARGGGLSNGSPHPAVLFQQKSLSFISTSIQGIIYWTPVMCHTLPGGLNGEKSRHGPSPHRVNKTVTNFTQIPQGVLSDPFPPLAGSVAASPPHQTTRPRVIEICAEQMNEALPSAQQTAV